MNIYMSLFVCVYRYDSRKRAYSWTNICLVHSVCGSNHSTIYMFQRLTALNVLRTLTCLNRYAKSHHITPSVYYYVDCFTPGRPLQYPTFPLYFSLF